jgi:hypothetical protein
MFYFNTFMVLTRQLNPSFPAKASGYSTGRSEAESQARNEVLALSGKGLAITELLQCGNDGIVKIGKSISLPVF